MVNRRGWAVAASGITVLLVVGTLAGRGVAVELTVAVGCIVGIAVLIVDDSARRGRSGWGWLAGCVLLPPLAGPAFIAVAVADRLRGRRGIEARWDPAERWYLLTGVVMTIAAAALALGPVHVQGESITGPGGSGRFSGSCSTALSVSLGGGPYGHLPSTAPGTPSQITAAQATVAQRCSAAAGQRVSASGLCLGGALLVTLMGGYLGRRHKPEQRKLVVTR